MAGEGAGLLAAVVDDGVGLPSGDRRGFRLLGMRERVGSLGGSLRADRREGQPGTRVLAIFGPGAGVVADDLASAVRGGRSTFRDTISSATRRCSSAAVEPSYREDDASVKIAY